MSRENTPSFSALLSDAVRSGIAQMHVSMPGSVEEFDPEQQRATVRPLLKRGYVDESGNRQSEELPVVPDVPVVFLSGGGGYRVTVPVQVGDTVLLIFSEGSLDRWLHGGGLVDPEDDRRNSLTDAVAIPGLRSFNDALPDFLGDALHIGDSGTSITVRPSDIRIGSDAATEPPALNSDLVALRQAVESWTPVPNDGGAALKAILLALFSTGWPTGATKVKVE